ncbi:unnamed protein product [Heligmosomoides polygyrus]|uniref:HTH_48 domain-containing protein n=1 Tax=Heligmosomoides polygyrus TaxID=6339 RepID=A0A3P8AC47_HELPZ|nr:unnamed protein product [Heligmosomoides polygyrus]
MAKQLIPTETHIRHVMLFLHQSGLNANESYRRLKDVYNESAPARSTVYQWFSKFAVGEFSVEGHELYADSDCDIFDEEGEDTVEAPPSSLISHTSSVSGKPIKRKVLCFVQSGAAYRPTVVTGFTIPKCNEVNRDYSAALHAFVNGVRSDIAKGNGGAIIGLTSDHVTKERHMDGLLIYPTASYMGCALRDMKVEGQSDLYDFKVVCVFVDYRPKRSRFLVELTGEPCKEDTDCSTDRTCEYGLCFAPVMDVVYQ